MKWKHTAPGVELVFPSPGWRPITESFRSEATLREVCGGEPTRKNVAQDPLRAWGWGVLQAIPSTLLSSWVSRSCGQGGIP